MIRFLEENDYNKGFLELINVFTRNPTIISFQDFSSAYERIQQQGGRIYVIEQDNRIVSTLKLFFEQKLHNNLAFVGHIEDVATHVEYRGQGLASSLIRHAIEEAKQKGCYKIILCANENNHPFYTGLGFQKKGTEFCIYV